MEINEIMRDQIFEILENQIKSNTPPETKTTYNRLRKEGFDDFETKQLIGQCISVEIFEVLKSGEPYNNKRYIKNLNKLPNKPF